jgi:DNA-binding SARP family transcriptional activator
VSTSFRLTPANRAAIVRVCERLDGLPLAIELAAARLRALTPEQIAERLDDRFRLLVTGNRAALPRHQTLRATIDWSCSLLDAAERALLARLAVFRGSFSVEAVEAVAVGDPVPQDQVLDLLAALVDKSLVEVVETGGVARYRLLETMREYSEEMLRSTGDLEPRMVSHAAFYGTLVREVEPLLRTPRRPEAMARLLPELENLRHAVSCSRQCDPQIHLRLVGLLHWFWFGTGQWPEAEQWLKGALALPAAQAPTLDRAALLFSAGAIAALQARSDDAVAMLTEAEAIAEREGEQRLLANVRNYLAMALNQVNDPAAVDMVLRARPWMVETNDLYALRLNFLLHGQALVAMGDLQGAIAATEEGVRAARVFGPARELGIALQQLATIVARTSDWPRSVSLLREALEALQRDPMLLFTARAMELMASGAASSGEAGDAARLYGAAASIRESIGAAMWPVDRALHEPYVQRARAALGAASYGTALSKGRQLGADEGVALALAVSAKLVASTEPDRTWDTREYRIPDAIPQPTAPSLGVRSFGGLEVAVNGVPLTRKDWTYTKARELLLFLLLHPSGQTREQVGVALWPDASAAQLRNSFHVALHHLRRALGNPEWVRFENDRYRLDVPGGVTFDAAAFEEAITRGLRAARQGAPTFDSVDAALQSYRGDFLEGEQAGDWHLEMRDRLARLYSDGLHAMGDALLRAGRAADAIPVLERLVQREPILESGWRALMQARAQSGDPAGVTRDYSRLEQLLRREGYPGPGRETRELFRRLARGA